jgi:ferritin
MLDERMEAALNKQLNAEMYSAYLYQSMAAWFEDQNLPGFANWMNNQVMEELMHSRKFYRFILDRGGRVLLAPIEGPRTEWESVTEVFSETLKHERVVSSLIHDLYGLSEELKDYPTRVFLHWFIDEQVEEEATSDEWLQKVRRVENSPSGLFQVDQEAALRAFDIGTALAGPE